MSKTVRRAFKQGTYFAWGDSVFMAKAGGAEDRGAVLVNAIEVCQCESDAEDRGPVTPEDIAHALNLWSDHD